MKKSNFIIICENGTPYKKGTIIKDFENSNDSIIFEGNKISSDKFIRLNEKLSYEDEKQVRDLIRNQIKFLFWNLYTKQSILLGN